MFRSFGKSRWISVQIHYLIQGPSNGRPIATITILAVGLYANPIEARPFFEAREPIGRTIDKQRLS